MEVTLKIDAQENERLHQPLVEKIIQMETENERLKKEIKTLKEANEEAANVFIEKLKSENLVLWNISKEPKKKAPVQSKKRRASKEQYCK